MRSQRLAPAGLIALLALTGCSGGSASPTAVASAGPQRSAGPQSSAGVALARLVIKGRAPLTGYSRAVFGPAWDDDNDDPLGHNGCDTRNDILHRDLGRVSLRAASRCVVASGVLDDPYTGRTIDFVRGPKSADVQIDHVVALGDAWQTGAARWDSAKRLDFANDPLNLLAVDGPANEAKGDSDAASWLPPNSRFRCTYVARQVAVKSKYQLWITQAERAALSRVLSECPN